MTFSGNGFAANESVALEFHSEPVALGTTTSDGDGRILATVQIPGDAEPGTHHIVGIGPGARGGTHTVAAEVTVADTARSTTTDNAGTRTGVRARSAPSDDRPVGDRTHAAGSTETPEREPEETPAPSKGCAGCAEFEPLALDDGSTASAEQGGPLDVGLGAVPPLVLAALLLLWRRVRPARSDL